MSDFPFIPVQTAFGKHEEWRVFLAGKPLYGRHPSFGDKDSALLYAELLQQEVHDGTFTIGGETNSSLRR